MYIYIFTYTYLRAAAPAADPGKEYLCRYFADFLKCKAMIFPKKCCTCSTYIYMDQHASIIPKQSQKIYPKSCCCCCCCCCCWCCCCCCCCCLLWKIHKNPKFHAMICRTRRSNTKKLCRFIHKYHSLCERNPMAMAIVGW